MSHEPNPLGLPLCEECGMPTRIVCPECGRRVCAVCVFDHPQSLSEPQGERCQPDLSNKEIVCRVLVNTGGGVQ